MTLKFKAKYSSFLMYKKNSVKCYTPEPRLVRVTDRARNDLKCVEGP